MAISSTRKRFFSTALIAAAVTAALAAAQVPDNDQAKGAPANAAEVREQIARVEKSLPQLPDRGAALYFLSTAKQYLGETREALVLLRECLALHEGFDPAGSPSFKILKGSKEFDDLVEGVHRDFPAVGRARRAFAIEEKDLVPEGIAYDRKQDIFYLSSLNRRKIVKVTAQGAASDFVPAERDNLLPVLGIRLDPGEGTVWAASWDEDAGRAELLHYDISSKLLGRYAPSDTAKHGLNETKHGFNDLVVRRNGEVIVTDSASNQVFRFDPRAHAFAPVSIYRALSAPNGIALADDDRQLFVADDIGIVRVNLSNGDSAEVNAGPRNTLAGVDGLYWRDGGLIAIQNGIGSPRIVAFRLSKDGTHVRQTTVLENRTAFTVLPTTGAIRGNDFYFMANTQIDNLAGSHIVDATRLERVRIGVLRLPW